jgi:hypothetical protein
LPSQYVSLYNRIYWELRKSAETKFNMFQSVLGFMELERLRTEIRDIKEKTIDERGHFIRPNRQGNR